MKEARNIRVIIGRLFQRPASRKTDKSDNPAFVPVFLDGVRLLAGRGGVSCQRQSFCKLPPVTDILPSDYSSDWISRLFAKCSTFCCAPCAVLRT